MYVILTALYFSSSCMHTPLCALWLERYLGYWSFWRFLFGTGNGPFCKCSFVCLKRMCIFYLWDTYIYVIYVCICTYTYLIWLICSTKSSLEFCLLELFMLKFPSIIRHLSISPYNFFFWGSVRGQMLSQFTIYSYKNVPLIITKYYSSSG